MLESFFGVCDVVPCGQPWRLTLAQNSFRNRTAGGLALYYSGPDGPYRNKEEPFPWLDLFIQAGGKASHFPAGVSFDGQPCIPSK